MKRLLVAAVLVAAVAFAAPVSAATTRQAAIVGTAEPYYGAGTCGAVTPGPMAVNAGDTVRWTNCDDTTHTVTFSGFGSPNINPGGTYERVFVAGGAFDYRCSIHPSMTGTIIVTSNVPTTAPAQQPTTTVATAPPTTTTVLAPTTTQSTVALDGVFDGSTTLPDDETTTTALDELAAGDSDDDSDDGNGFVIFLLLLGIGAIGAGGVYAVRHLRAGG